MFTYWQCFYKNTIPSTKIVMPKNVARGNTAMPHLKQLFHFANQLHVIKCNAIVQYGYLKKTF